VTDRGDLVNGADTSLTQSFGCDELNRLTSARGVYGSLTIASVQFA
jgi:hypothetical protein